MSPRMVLVSRISRPLYLSSVSVTPTLRSFVKGNALILFRELPLPRVHGFPMLRVLWGFRDLEAFAF